MDHKKTAPIDIIAAARALIEPLTGYTQEPWSVSEYDGTGYVYGPAQGYDEGFSLEDARLIAAAPDLRDMDATLADALEAEQAKVAAAYEAAAADCARQAYLAENAAITGLPEQARLRESMAAAFVKAACRIRALTPPDAQAALDKLLAEARLEGWRAGRDVAADEAATYDCSGGSDDFTCGFHSGYRDAVQQIVEGIREVPEPKEANHG